VNAPERTPLSKLADIRAQRDHAPSHPTVWSGVYCDHVSYLLERIAALEQELEACREGAIDPYGVVLRIVWRDPTVLNDWHTAADFSDEMTHIVSVGIRTGETPDTIFLTREVCADGELRGTNGIPKPLIVHQERLRAHTKPEGE